MKLFIKIICFALALTAALSLVACKKNKIDEAVDYGYVEGYYSELAYETKSDGSTTEFIYLLCTDEELTNAVGKKVVNFDMQGNMTGYTITIGVKKIERLISYSCGENASYYSDITFDKDEKMTVASWENVETNTETGVTTKNIGVQEFYENGKVKTETVEIYTNDKLDSKTVKEYNEEGELVSEK